MSFLCKSEHPTSKSRRDFLGKTLTFAALAPISPHLLQIATPFAGLIAILELLKEGSHAQSVAEAFLASTPDFDAKDTFQTLATKINSLSKYGSAPSEAALLAITEDFRNERTVEIDGWILSRTEADLCALSVLFPHGF